MIALAIGTQYKATALPAYHLFYLTPGSDPYDPRNYTASNSNPSILCSGTNKICAIDIPDYFIYTSLNAPIQEYVGKPKVINTPYQDLADHLVYALANATNPAYFIDGTIVYLRDE